jgi:8-oxo-dGTP pyrophosphatase MutT (NUDIX family)
MPYWKKNSDKVLFDHPRLKIIEDDVTLPNGKQTQYMLFADVRNYVTVIACREDGKIALVKEYSYPLNQFLIQFPEGSIEEDEDTLEAAKRELEEEAGLKAGKLEIIGWNLDNHRRNTAKQLVVIAHDLQETEKIKGDDEEFGIETIWCTKVEIENMVIEHDLIQKNTLAAWALFSIQP